jgi:hypothetical protein
MQLQVFEYTMAQLQISEACPIHSIASEPFKGFCGSQIAKGFSIALTTRKLKVSFRILFGMGDYTCSVADLQSS